MYKVDTGSSRLGFPYDFPLIDSFICQKLYVPGAVLESGNTIMNRTGKVPTPKELAFPCRKKDNEKINQ